MNILFAIALWQAALFPALAQVKFPPRPPQGKFIFDEAKLLQSEDAAEIRKIAGEAFAAKRSPIVVVTIKSLSEYGASGWPLQHYAKNLFAEWAIGWSDWNYGMLLLVSTGDRKARIELGASWGHLKDADAQRVMNEEVVPRFKRGEFSAGLLAGVKGLRELATSEIQGEPTPLVYGPAPSKTPPAPAYRERYVPYQYVHRSSGVPDTSSWLGTAVIIILVLVAVVVVVSAVSRGGASSWGGSYGGYSPGCSAFAGGCLGSGLGSWFGGGGYHSYWDDPWDRPWGGGGWFGGGGSGSGWSSGGDSWGSSDSSSSGGGFSGGGGASGEW